MRPLASIVSLAALLAASAMHGAVVADGDGVRVESGEYTVLDRTVRIRGQVLLKVRPSETVLVRDEELRLPDVEPGGYWTGAMLAGPRTVAINAPAAFIEDSLVVREASSGRVLAEGADYRVSARFGLLGLGTEPSIAPDEPVLATYRYSLQRIDAVVWDADSGLRVVEGSPSLAEPLPPELVEGGVCLARVYRPFGAVTVLPEHVYPIRSGAGHVVTRTTRGRVPRTLRALERGEQVTVVCLGDSITAGGDASSPAGAYVSLFEDGLRRRFPQADLRVVNISIGGTRSAQWVHNGSYPGLPRLPAEKCTLDRVTEAGPDLVTVEFLNDVTLDRDELPRIYGALLDRLCGTGAEVILITPSFAEPGIMGAESLGAGDSARFPHYVAFLWGLAEREGVALADASSRWESLRAEGLPYMTLLRNHHNHPGDRGHRLFSEELLKCFEHE